MILAKTTDWQFPVGGKQYSLSKLFTALAEAQSGYYLLGENQQWHGGIHVDAQVLNQLQLTDKVAVKCMAEGEVVAYRLNDNYLRLEKPDKKVHGWVSDKQPTVKRLSPWQWRDYQSLIEKATPHDFHQHAINKKQQLNQGDYQEIELLNTLSQKIKARHLEESTLTDRLTPAHLKQALKHRWLAERLARIHVNYESEWYAEIKADGTMPKWEIAAQSQQELGLIKACLTEETPQAAQQYY